ncbi:MAG: UDP-N-acetylmuramoyl-L-alanyl-D-glutamate--2,6-diaminopimelate ligase [Candidatus Omnitrophica bacterium]|nr:UDP-N-acetylmuramoyl-L-alanyl-D-glutamate--2,6-diaminopimelate ligase [Candidatus Omnitrophota bacterium]MDD5429387.1 UDP-N-acetylmuramoyl-L-alanyl-D-glutamate--2,6-diaminopimelate ligase [Candidatus Omnitrophota bacterium]
MYLEYLFPSQRLNNSLKGINIKDVYQDSRLVKKGCLFFIIERESFDIYSCLRNLEAKVSVFVAARQAKKKVNCLINKKPVIFVKDVEKELRRVSDILYRHSRNTFKFIGVTGTNGKTTVAFIIYEVLKSMDKDVSLLGTVKHCLGSKEQRAVNTTPGFLDLRKMLVRVQEEGSEFVVMEVSSHALSQRRIEGIDFEKCVFTNLSREHLDYHKTMRDYFLAKQRLFFGHKNKAAIVNADDYYGRKLISRLPAVITYGVNRESEYRAKNLKLGPWGSSFSLVAGGKVYPVTTCLYGKHNIYNILAAVAALASLGFPLPGIISAVASFKPVDGRLQKICDNIFIDYAHTPDAIKKAILALKQSGYNEIICLFGCGGGRDKGKRRAMGAEACALADFSFITSDNPRNENPEDICRQIVAGFSKNNYILIIDRKKAIEEAISRLRKNDKKDKNLSGRCLLICGKGHEEFQIIGERKIPFKDSRVVKSLVKESVT